MIVKMHTINGKGYISLCRYIIYSLSLRKDKRNLGSRYKKHAIYLLNNMYADYHVVKIGILIPRKFTLNPTFVAIYKRDSARH